MESHAHGEGWLTRGNDGRLYYTENRGLLQTTQANHGQFLVSNVPVYPYGTPVAYTTPSYPMETAVITHQHEMPEGAGRHADGDVDQHGLLSAGANQEEAPTEPNQFRSRRAYERATAGASKKTARFECRLQDSVKKAFGSTLDVFKGSLELLLQENPDAEHYSEFKPLTVELGMYGPVDIREFCFVLTEPLRRCGGTFPKDMFHPAGSFRHHITDLYNAFRDDSKAVQFMVFQGGFFYLVASISRYFADAFHHEHPSTSLHRMTVPHDVENEESSTTKDARGEHHRVQAPSAHPPHAQPSGSAEHSVNDRLSGSAFSARRHVGQQTALIPTSFDSARRRVVTRRTTVGSGNISDLQSNSKSEDHVDENGGQSLHHDRPVEEHIKYGHRVEGSRQAEITVGPPRDDEAHESAETGHNSTRLSHEEVPRQEETAVSRSERPTGEAKEHSVEDNMKYYEDGSESENDEVPHRTSPREGSLGPLEGGPKVDFNRPDEDEDHDRDHDHEHDHDHDVNNMRGVLEIGVDETGHDKSDEILSLRDEEESDDSENEGVSLSIDAEEEQHIMLERDGEKL